MNYRLVLQYDGTDFHGWQIQHDLRTVQGELTRVLSVLEGGAVTVNGSGRTDAGVHAEGQVANVKLSRDFAPVKLRNATNGNLPRDVRVLSVDVVPEEFHARYSAQSKTYCYRVIHAPVISPFWARYAHQESRSLDIERMRMAAKALIGEHDWTAFSAADAEAGSRVRTVTQLRVLDEWEDRAQGLMIQFEISANGFLRYMVRSIVGTLLAVGRGEIEHAAIVKALINRDRSLAGATAPAQGLTLRCVNYDCS